MTVACPIEDRLALYDLAVGFAHAVDSLHDLDGICDVFAADAVFDLSPVGFPSLRGQDEIRAFYAQSFAGMAAQAHYLTNFAVTAYSAEGAHPTASIRVYVTGMARYKAGGGITLHGRYYFDLTRTGNGWKATHYTMNFLIPPDA